MDIAVSVANWLLGQQNITAAIPVFVQIGHRTYSAARYTEDRNGVEETRLYIVGEMPPFHNRMRRICYRTDDSGCDWHLIAWFRQKVACTEWSEVHKFGSHFILAQWSPVENWAADQCQKKPYHRITMTITDCGPSDFSVNQPSEENQNGDD
jgi:hypothetical protein